MYDFLIVGAGLYGATFARLATDAGYKCIVIDKRDAVGGNVYTEEEGGIMVHKYGPHIFHTDNKDVWEFVNYFAEFNSYRHMPIARWRGKVYNLPFNMNTFSQIFSRVTPESAMAKIKDEIEEAGITSITNLEEQAISMVGTTIYEKLVKGYTEKQWGRPCKELPPSIIRRLPLRFTYDNSYFNDRYQGIPICGYTEMIVRILNGIDVMLNQDYFDGIELFNAMATHIVYTGPIDRFFRYAHGELEYRSLCFENEFHSGTDNMMGAAVTNFVDEFAPYTRVVEHKHFTGVKVPYTILTYEYSQPWQIGKEPYYPIRDAKNTLKYEEYRKDAAQLKNVSFGGRLGTYQYMDMDDVIEQAAMDVSKMIFESDEEIALTSWNAARRD